MPTIRKRGPARRLNETLTEDQLEYLITGDCLDAGEGVPYRVDSRGRNFPFVDEAHARRLWKRHRAYIMSLEGVEFGPGLHPERCAAAVEYGTTV